MQLLDTTRAHQSSLASYCRTGELKNIPGIKQENITQYRRLVYNVVDDMLQNAYPLTYNLLTKKEWNNAVNDFFINHSCQSPQVWYMPKEFYEYIVETEDPLTKKYPFLEDLLLFEWMEVEVFMMEDHLIDYSKEGDIIINKLVVNPEHHLLSFSYPVHNKSAKKIKPDDKQTYFVMAHRHPDGNVIFTDLSPAFVKMLEYLTAHSLSIHETIKKFETEFNILLTKEDKQSIIAFFEAAYEQRLIIGFAA
ncbi:HvfC/BufC N-terminal domain-containing protein [Ferruginibacter albus]|uniref:HvfC/BufC N-terminal domain-containing protein n=1 Tax=Ferruginibacter albus TaxID=2875540 RepID=UPI001CC735AA|nr:putative DNA-binding domain-containing protein [Ferruginibacter albus]UAY53155.1 putative DNA-binding domain-containing protein [Ferruginibacter albus]